MARVLRGNRRAIPAGLTPMEWASQVFALMDQGYSEQEARDLIQVKYAHQAEERED